MSTGETRKQWRKDNPEKEKQYNINAKKYKHQWYLNNIEITKKRAKEWVKENPEKRKEVNRIHTKKRYRIARKILGKKLGRELTKAETVHHIDMDESNNDETNLYIYDNNSKHLKGHGTLNRIVSDLLRDNIIGFKDGKYYYKGVV